ncbi:alpha/beta hydrolase [Spongiactinospora sp. TRM90649]|uniref:alpha/beta fold hydrolase n=1 Tax=Spongiactinospora sp. TRM90649 TaxID=3031114 RepID=UPI0023F63D2D|nr:alpha/beta hydrolase [Spongiactinospora sp. TRM90649]MDF5758007.1 alpha/beta hydrolase [Spongiactinospora sp. TRM90649]
MSTYVLIPGYWLGAWAWEQVTGPLRAAGHDVHPVTLTGLGDRVHLATPDTDLDTHIQDVINVVTYADLHDVILVGHSGGAMAASGAADRIPGRIARLVFLDAVPLPDGTALIDAYDPDFRQYAEDRIKNEGGGTSYPLPDWPDLERGGASLEGLGDTERAMITARAAAQPAASVTQPLHLDQGGYAGLPKTLITTSFPLEQIKAMIDAGHPLAAFLSGPEWDLREVPTGHWPMFSRPEATVSALSSV